MGVLTPWKVMWIVGDPLYSDLAEKNVVGKFDGKYRELLNRGVNKADARRQALDYCGVKDFENI